MTKEEDAVKSETKFADTTRETVQASEDDYSVPYELKNFAGGKLDILNILFVAMYITCPLPTHTV